MVVYIELDNTWKIKRDFIIAFLLIWQSFDRLAKCFYVLSFFQNKLYIIDIYFLF